MTKVKICGITRVSDAIAAVDAGADFIGLVLSSSPRRVDITQVEPIVNAVREKAHVVGVFASEIDLIGYDRTSAIALDYYQVYFEYQDLVVRKPRRAWIRSFWAHEQTDIGALANGDLLLCDFKHEAKRDSYHVPGGCAAFLRERTLIAGKLTVDNVAAVVRALRPFGVDVARGTELSPGVKDVKKIEQFIARAQNA
ncbi:MAG: hypothetical protein AB1772_00510 [Candidatus Zixiibacteriota bacterium]